jgi:uncharacterized protein
MDATPKRPLPIWDTDTEGYWKGAREHKLMVKRCTRCGYVGFPPYPICRRCSSMELDWVPAAGGGHIYTWTTVYRSTRPEFVADVPYTLAVVELSDYPIRIPARLKGVAPRGVQVGASVRIQFEDVTPEVSLPYWVLSDD